MTTNMASQAVALPLPVEQTAVERRLGTFTKFYKASLGKTIAGATLFVVGGVFFLGGGIFPADLEVSTRVILIVFALLFLGMAISMIYTAVQGANQRIYLFQQGLVIEKGSQVQAFPWNQAAEVWQSITRNYRNGVYVGTTYSFTLGRVDGYQIKLGNLTKGISELGPAITQGITRELVPRALNSIRSGQTLPFPPFSINQQGISNGRETLPWSQIQAVDVKRGRVTVKKAGALRNWGTVMVAKIPNFLVFTVVADEMIRQARGGR